MASDGESKSVYQNRIVMKVTNSMEGCPLVLTWILWICLVLFSCRVTGQILVEFFEVTFLPPSKEWFSGIISYPILLVSQIVIIFFLVKVSTDLTNGTGRFSHPTKRASRNLRLFGSIYLLAMILRYILRMYIYPEERWTGGCIPIFFHCVLATYVLAWSNWENVSKQIETEES